MSDTRRIEVSASELAHGVPESDYLRLLTWPPDRPLSPPLQQRARGAREWYARHGRPFLAARRLSIAAIDCRSRDARDRRRADQLGAGRATACLRGPCARGRGGQLRRRGDPARRADVGRRSPGRGLFSRPSRGRRDGACCCGKQAGLLSDPSSPATEYASPHLSPGSAEWDIADQSILMRLLSEADPVVCGPITLLDSGALDPAHSALAVYGLARSPGRLTARGRTRNRSHARRSLLASRVGRVRRRGDG